MYQLIGTLISSNALFSTDVRNLDVDELFAA
jgi:hypothetical protein